MNEPSGFIAGALGSRHSLRLKGMKFKAFTLDQSVRRVTNDIAAGVITMSGTIGLVCLDAKIRCLEA
ncbi:hypothetical protein EVAR_12492_1 [Eumeta japonica]|uniref:Uncharacterized protein n=1 Tax=Eumeta variegata TaxID=151549 RepID=A0A4C1TPJ7_EUMVA|nr:hypothetical protein EVAR_12492_1 [Eumeta japonica]